MFKNHPKGLAVLFFTEMWERFGFYTMLAIFVLYLGENFGWSEAKQGSVYGAFLAGVYFTPIFGGWIADNLLGYGRTIMVGAVTMAIGYALMANPTQSEAYLYAALAVVAIGNGLFKANISVLVGNLYSHADGSLKDAAYNIFYMGINIGAFFAPLGAKEIKNFFINHFGFSLARGYNAGFALAAVGMIFSLIIFLAFRKYYREADYQSRHHFKQDRDLVLSREQERERILALVTVFAIVIFFWMAFHQNGYTLTLFAKNYTVKMVDRFTFLLFDTISLLALIGFVLSVVILFKRGSSRRTNLLAAISAGITAGIVLFKLSGFQDTNRIHPESFQIFNPLFIVFLTPLIVGFFAWLNRRGKEPSSPGKIGLGMLITAVSFSIMVLASLRFAGFENDPPQALLAAPYWLISSYFVITLGELFLSPIGLSFVSKVAPPRHRGLMMGGWFMATAIGNYLSGFIGRFYEKWYLWQFFLLLVITSLIASGLVWLNLKRLKRATEM